ncbi:MAG: hypothetical protein IJZ74_05190 [Clostridia bacterium]|nr:hypothetical protein [Clostridia bacterium]
MKKIFALVLALAMLLGCTSAMAWDDALPYDSITVNPADLGNVTYDVEADNALAALLGATDYTVNVYVLNLKTDNATLVGEDVATGTVDGTTDTVTINWDAAWTDKTIEGSEVEYVIQVEYTVPGVTDPVTMEMYHIYANLTKKNSITLSTKAWYPDNTACVFGPQMADSWKTYAVVDLTVEGTQELKLVGAGAWELGKVFVTVAGDEVTVDYLMHEDVVTTDVNDDINVDAEYVNVYADVESMDIKAESTFAFGTPFSIANDLAGDTTVVLYVQLQVDYPSHSPFVYRFWPNMPANKAIVEAMNGLLAE